jgi:hypothetical protein
VSQKTWDTDVIVKMVRDKYVSVIQNYSHIYLSPSLQSHIYHSPSLQSHVYPTSFVTHEFCATLTYLSLQKTWDKHVIVKMVSDKYVSVAQNSCVTKDVGYTCDCKDGE